SVAELEARVPAEHRNYIDKLAEGGHDGAKALATYYVGQAVGLMNVEQSARSVVYDFMQDYADAVERLSGTIED
ncbi:MAG: hypothetical protein OXR03_04055, partial [Rhodospirillaceae bacterium]|nr:hypothetical protein [Rhodospirillaceae bacterium]